MLFDAAHTDELKAWLASELGPICDADPEVLSDYVLALLKHDASETELQKLLREQLEDFLAAETEGFVSRTFDALASKAYLGPSATNSASAPATDPSSAEASASSRKRGADEDAERSSPPRQTRKLDDDSDASSSPSHRNGSTQSRPAIYDEPLDTRGPRSRDQRERGPGGGGGGRNGARKEMCRDFHNMGYCPRGASCKYEHSVNVMPNMPGQMGMGAPFGMPPMMGPGGPMGQMRPPHMGPGPMMFPGAPGYGMPPQGWAPNMRPPHGMQNHGGGGAGSPGPHGPNGHPGAPGEGGLAARLGGQASPASQAPQDAGAAGSPLGPDAAGDVSAQQQLPPHMMMGGPAAAAAGPGAGRGGFGGRGRGRGGPPGHFASQRRSNTTLVIENVPAEYLDLIKVNEYFKKFGTITNISIDVPGTKALVSYSQPHEAKAAHESPDVIFGNRFVKVYFQRLDEPQAGGAAPPAAAAQQAQPRPPYQPKPGFVPGQTSNVYHARPPAASPGAGSAGPGGAAASEERKKLFEDQKQKQATLDAQLAEQKALLGKLSDKTASAEERKATMTSLKKLGDDIKASTEAVKAAVAALAAAPAAAGGAGAKDAAASQNWREQKEKREKEQLDRELELHSKGASPGQCGRVKRFRK
ncbi:uncharacterized protein PFL1_01549 [Pseudozyma flocculosa PF-1]|uniref:uncharacterized protein n=1 Tax=Pseudozyma flocculosa PF-1 TaxID=1277687 RepID=UPI000456087F|nr:uncharacterized protein PFL1_01549 [Pseudozyma flocculosa PF-1]EPQ30648.1 hypothetical protein PFL1_01549 [Pseudozyma flocculosa PF-1]